MARDAGISQPTVHRYIRLLEVSGILTRVYPYYKSRGKRLIKSPKFFFLDPALAVFLSRYHDIESLNLAREKGNFYENLIFMNLRVFSDLMTPKANLYFYRDTYGKEVDFVIEWGKKVLIFEAKLTRRVTSEDTKNLLYFMHEYPNIVRGVVLYAGSEVKWLHSKVIAMPWWMIS